MHILFPSKYAYYKFYSHHSMCIFIFIKVCIFLFSSKYVYLNFHVDFNLQMFVALTSIASLRSLLSRRFFVTRIALFRTSAFSWEQKLSNISKNSSCIVGRLRISSFSVVMPRYILFYKDKSGDISNTVKPVFHNTSHHRTTLLSDIFTNHHI